MAGGAALSRAITERTIALWIHARRAYEGKSSELILPGPQSRVVVGRRVALGVRFFEPHIDHDQPG